MGKILDGVRWAMGGLTLAALVPAHAQDTASLRPVRVVVASAKLQVALDKPLYFTLLNVSLAPGRSAVYSGGGGFIFVTGGKLELSTGKEKAALGDGEAKYLPGGAQTTLHAPGPKPTTMLQYVLAPAAAPGEKAYAGAATTVELFRSREPAALSAGPHEFSLTRVTSPVGAPPPPMHHRSGAALYRVLSGAGTLHLQGRDEARATGAVQYEPNGFVHTWENSGKMPLVLLQANISAEGAPEIIWLK